MDDRARIRDAEEREERRNATRESDLNHVRYEDREVARERVDIIFKVCMVALTLVIIPWAVWVTQSIYSTVSFREISQYKLDHINSTLEKIEQTIGELDSHIRSVERKE
jgi:hypothetical protein